MGASADNLIVKLTAAVFVDPHVRVRDGKVQHVKGFLREFGTVMNSASPKHTDRVKAVYAADTDLRAFVADNHPSSKYGGLAQPNLTSDEAVTYMADLSNKYGFPDPDIVVEKLGEDEALPGYHKLAVTTTKFHMLRSADETLHVPADNISPQVLVHEAAHMIADAQGTAIQHDDAFVGVYRSLIKEEFGDRALEEWDKGYDFYEGASPGLKSAMS